MRPIYASWRKNPTWHPPTAFIRAGMASAVTPAWRKIVDINCFTSLEWDLVCLSGIEIKSCMTPEWQLSSHSDIPVRICSRPVCLRLARGGCLLEWWWWRNELIQWRRCWYNFCGSHCWWRWWCLLLYYWCPYFGWQQRRCSLLYPAVNSGPQLD